LVVVLVVVVVVVVVAAAAGVGVVSFSHVLDTSGSRLITTRH
jgi:hypothetical protein